MNASLLRRIGFLVAPDLALAVSFAFTLWAPYSDWAMAPADCLVLMLLEGAMIVVSALVGVYFAVSRIFFPLLVLGFLGYWMRTAATGHPWAFYSFAWAATAAFVDGWRAHRGAFGPARENPAHPHRRYDRMFFLYLATAPILPALWAAGFPRRWAVWGLAYFTLLTLVDSVFRGLFDRIPQGLLRRVRGRAGPETVAKFGLCFRCVYLQPALPARPGRMVRCGLSATKKRFPEYPATPVETCDGFRPMPEEYGP